MDQVSKNLKLKYNEDSLQGLIENRQAIFNQLNIFGLLSNVTKIILTWNTVKDSPVVDRVLNRDEMKECSEFFNKFWDKSYLFTSTTFKEFINGNHTYFILFCYVT